MAKFTDAQKALQTAREEMEIARQALYSQQELLKLQRNKIKYRLDQERLPFLPDSDPDQEILVELQDGLYDFQLDFENASHTHGEIQEEFDQLDSHQEMVKNLDDGYPILLMPLRIQTRFVNVKHLANNVPQEAIFDVSELEDPAPISEVLCDDREPYKDLQQVHTYFSLMKLNHQTHTYYHHYTKDYFQQNKIYKGRNWLKVIPDTLELWIRIYPDDIFVHSHETHLTPTERADGEAFWKKWWTIHQENENALADELRADELTGKPLFVEWTKLQRKYQHTRAAWIYKETMPYKEEEQDFDYTKEPDFSKRPVRLKSEIWTQPILSWVMPDKFVVTLIQDGVTKHFEGNRVPHPLKLSPAPSQENRLEEIKWAEDFDEAEKIGMAIRVPVKANGFKVTKPFQQLVVVGIKASLNPEKGKEALEALLENHRFKGKGMSILPQGTPSNNFEEVRSGFSANGLPPEATFRLELGDPLFDNEAQWKTIKDGKYLVDALGVSPAAFQHVYNSDSKDIAHAFAMNKLLWSATIGYYLQQFFQPIVSPENIENVRKFFLDHVSARGFLPVFRINQQPYGILPITNFGNEDFFLDDDVFFTNLYEKALAPFNNFWGTLAQKIKNITDPSLQMNEGQFSEEFVRMLGLSASSQAFYQRPQIGNHVIENSVAANFEQQPRHSPIIWGVDTDPGPENPQDYVRYAMLRESLPYFRRPVHGLNNLGFDFYSSNPYSILSKITYTKERIFSQHFAEIYRKFPNALIDKYKPSPNRTLSTFDVNGEQLNYLEWLKESTYQQLIDDHFKKGGREEGKPDSLLYLLARQAIARNYIEVAAKLAPDEVVIEGGQIRQHKDISTIDFELEHLFEHSFFDIYEGEMVRKFGAEVRHYLKKIGKSTNELHPDSYAYNNNKWSFLNQKKRETDEETIGEFLEVKIQSDSTAQAYLPLTDAKRALGCLAEVDTKSLERLFSEHLDLCSYRLDAWMLGLVNRRLSQLRDESNGNPAGIYLGAFGYVENLNPGSAKFVYRVVEDPELQEVDNQFNTNELVIPMLHFKSFAEKGIEGSEVLAKSYVYLGKDASWEFERSETQPEKIVNKPFTETSSQGFIHTPSTAHAITAAILRSGFMANNPSQDFDEFAINLSSERVRKALYYIEGMRNGQELAALLGYQFERELHDSPVPFLDAYIFELRRAFPLQKEQEPNASSSEETVPPFNVVHGLDLLHYYRARDQHVTNTLQSKGIYLESIGDLAAEQIELAKTHIKRALDHLSQSMDAISDLLVSESIYHAAKGDLERSGAVLKMLSNDKEIAIPEIVHTPKSGIPLGHVLGVQFNLSGTEKIWAGVESPRSLLNPGLNRWLSEQLPHPSKMCFNVDVNGTVEKLSIRNLLLQPIDLLALFQEKNPLSETSALTFLIKEVAIKFFNPPLDAPLKVLYYDKRDMGVTQKTLGELKPLFDNLLKIVKNSRPLFPTDLQLTSSTKPLEKESYATLDNSAIIEVFETIVNGEYARSLYKAYNSLKSYTLFYKNSMEGGFPEGNQQGTYTRILQLLHELLYFNQLKEDYNLPFAYSEKNAEAIIEKGLRAYRHYEAVGQKAKDFFKEVKKITDKKKQWEALVTLAQMIFGNSIWLMPNFYLNDPEEFKAAKDFPDLMADTDEQAHVEWLQGLSLVRENMRAYKKLEIFRNLFEVKAKSEKLEVLQLPYQTNAENYRWLGTSFSPQLTIKGEHLSIAMEYPVGYKTTNLQAGMVIDSWTERIQSETTETAFALHYNQPNAEPPQTCLLCVSPVITESEETESENSGGWKWDDIVGCVLSSIDMAKKRAVEPEHLEEDTIERPAEAHYMSGHPMKFILPALSIPVSNTENTPALGFDEDNNHF